MPVSVDHPVTCAVPAQSQQLLEEAHLAAFSMSPTEHQTYAFWSTQGWMSASHSERIRKDVLQLHAVNNTSIPTFGTRSLTLSLGLRRTFRWALILADVRQPILVADFLCHFNLSVDIVHHQLLDGVTHLSIQGIATSDSSLQRVSLCHPGTCE